MPPAEAPIATINKSFLCSESAEGSSLEELRGLRPDDFGFIYFFQVAQTRGCPSGRRGEQVVTHYNERTTVCASLCSATAAGMTAPPILVFPGIANNFITFNL